MPKCRENRKRRLRRRKHHEARLKRLSTRHLPIPWASLVSIVHQDLGRPRFSDVIDYISGNDILRHLLHRDHVEITSSKKATPWTGYALTVHQHFDNMTAEKAIEQMRRENHRGMLRIADIIEAAFLRVAGGRPVLEDWKFVVRRGEWLVQKVLGEIAPGLVKSEMSAWFGFRQLTKAEKDQRDAEAGGVP